MSKVEVIAEGNLSFPENEGKISDYFIRGRHKNSRKVVAYTKRGNFVYVEHIQDNARADSNTFDISTEKGNDAFCSWAFEKLGLDFKGYKKRKDIVWQ